MEHLPIHLPHEAALGGPVQYRWMYPFERFMFHLKKKVKNLSKVEGSIVAQSINEETSNFSSYYFGPTIQTKARKPGRYDDGGEKPVYHTYVPDIFYQIGRLSGKQKQVWLSDEEFNHIHTYILRNCETILPFENVFVDQITGAYPNMTNSEVENMKQTHFANWLKYYIQCRGSSGREIYPTWLEELVGGPLSRAVSSPMYCTRGYVFKKRPAMSNRKTVNHGVLVRAEPLEYFGEITDILEIEYPGYINLKCILFKCDWYDPTVGRGVRLTKFGVTEVNASRRLRKYDPFILASQALQVCYIPYPKVTTRLEPWIMAHQINPRGRVDGVSDSLIDPLQQAEILVSTQIEQIASALPLIDVENVDVDEVFDNDGDEEGQDEFEESSDSARSDYSSNSD